MKRSEPYSGPFPRPRHSHTCAHCKRHKGAGAVYCYKARCTKAQLVDRCQWCEPLQESPTYRPPAAPAASWPDVQEIAQWYTLIDEKRRQAIFSALSTEQRRQAFQYGLAVSWNLLPEYARDLVRAEWWEGRRPAAAPAPAATIHLPACGYLKSGADQTPCQCAQLRLAAAIAEETAPAIASDPIPSTPDPWAAARAKAQLSLF